MSNITHTMRGNNCIAANCNETREWAEKQGHTIIEVDAEHVSQDGRRDYYQLGRSNLLHVVIFDTHTDADLTLCGRDIYETGRLANDVEDQPVCTNCRRSFEKAQA